MLLWGYQVVGVSFGVPVIFFFPSFPKAAHLGKAEVCLPAFSQLPDKDVGPAEKLGFKAVNVSSKVVAIR